MANARDVEYTADGVDMVGRLAVPDGDSPVPGVLIAHEANGLDDHQRSRAERLAELGYAALAMDYHGRGRVYTDRDSMMARIADLGSSPDRMQAIGVAALAALKAEPRVNADRLAATGYCFGAVMALELARGGADLKAVVGFHPGWADHNPDDTRRITAKVLLCIGAQDPLVPAEIRRAYESEFSAAELDWQMHIYGGAKHSFTHPNAAAAGIPGLEYHEPSDQRSWKAMLDLFAEVFAT